jgi:hypothetical protein
MSTSKFNPGDKVENTKSKRVGFVKKQRGAGVYLVSVQGFGEREWNEAEMTLSNEPKGKRNQTWNKSA